MAELPGTYDSDNAKAITFDKLLSMFSSFGAKNIYVKKLSPNDNSKNQPYFGGHLTDVPFIPTGKMIASETKSKKPSKGHEIKYQASLRFKWIDAEGRLHFAPHAKLIYYPQYPEVRFSGFLLGSSISASRWMDPKKQGRDEGRWLVLGISPDETVYGYLVTPECSLAKELEAAKLLEINSVFKLVGRSYVQQPVSTRNALIAKLHEIYRLGWVEGQRLNGDGKLIPYKAPNGGGYTLEGLLGITPNGYAEPDYLGWEVKQFGVKRFPTLGAGPTTLMTPEPDGGFYRDQGAVEFVRRYGYADKSGIVDRLNFGGKHIVGVQHQLTNLTLKLEGFDSEKAAITDARGAVVLVDGLDKVTASWSFAKLMDHWKRKHSQAVYIPCVKRPNREKSVTEYHYGQNVELGVGTNFEMVLKTMGNGVVYYDPGIKLEQALTERAKIKRRSQFRIAHKQIHCLYNEFEFVDVTKLGPKRFL